MYAELRMMYAMPDTTGEVALRSRLLVRTLKPGQMPDEIVAEFEQKLNRKFQYARLKIGDAILFTAPAVESDNPELDLSAEALVLAVDPDMIGAIEAACKYESAVRLSAGWR